MRIPVRAKPVFMLIAQLAAALIAQSSQAQLVSIGPELLQQDVAFVIDASATPSELRFAVDIEEGYYLYRDRITLQPVVGAPRIEGLVTPPGKVHVDQFFGRVETYRDRVEFFAPRPTGDSDLLVELVVQGCADLGVCYPPYASRFTFTPTGATGILVSNNLPDFLSAPVEPVSNTSALYSQLEEGSLLLIALLFFNAGILLSFTPCVLPLIPVAIGVVTGSSSRSRKGAFALGAVYVGSMALCYSVIGVATAKAGGALAGTLQQPVIAYPIALLISALGVGLLLELNFSLLPASISSRLQNLRHKQGTVPGAIASGIVAAVVVSPCVAAPLAGALLFIATTGDAVIGGTALMALGLGMGVFPLLCAMGAKRFVPRAGPASVMMRQLFGLLLIALGIWVLPAQVPVILKMSGFGALAGAALYLSVRLVLRLASGKAKIAAGALGSVFGILMLVMFIGAFTGGTNVLAPLSHLSEKGKLEFTTVMTMQEYTVERAKTADRPSLEYYYADWCVSCRELEGYTFTDAEVVKQLSGHTLIKVDVTSSSPEVSLLMAQSRILGPPALIVRDGQGMQLVKLAGYINASALLGALASAEGS